MTDREKAIVMAHTGICMLTGNKFQIFHKYIEDIMERPIMTHEIALLEDVIKQKSKADFITLCDDENEQKWISVKERLPETDEIMLVTCQPKKGEPNVNRAYYNNGFWHGSGSMSNVTAWQPLPAPYKEGD